MLLATLVGLIACSRTETSTPPNKPARIAASAVLDPAPIQTDAVQRIAFGSCLDPTLPHPILATVAARSPDVFVMTGDNVYADAAVAKDLERAYAALADSESYADLAARSVVLAAWDDHDYGSNDAGREYPLKEDSKRVMLDFFGVPADAPRRLRDGNYDSVVLGPVGRRVQVILLDTRWFRDPLIPAGGIRRYLPHSKPGPTVLGEPQWAWLQDQLRVPAELRLLVSSIQLVTVDHAFESWGLFPAERQRMFDLIASTEAEGVVVVTGDRHRGELACAHSDAIGYPLVEITASAFNRPSASTESNRFRIAPEDPYGDPNFGEIDIRWDPAPRMRIALRDTAGRSIAEVELELAALRRNVPAASTTLGRCVSLVDAG